MARRFIPKKPWSGCQILEESSAPRQAAGRLVTFSVAARSRRRTPSASADATVDICEELVNSSTRASTRTRSALAETGFQHASDRFPRRSRARDRAHESGIWRHHFRHTITQLATDTHVAAGPFRATKRSSICQRGRAADARAEDAHRRDARASRLAGAELTTAPNLNRGRSGGIARDGSPRRCEIRPPAGGREEDAIQLYQPPRRSTRAHRRETNMILSSVRSAKPAAESEIRRAGSTRSWSAVSILAAWACSWGRGCRSQQYA